MSLTDYLAYLLLVAHVPFAIQPKNLARMRGPTCGSGNAGSGGNAAEWQAGGGVRDIPGKFSVYSGLSRI